MKTYLEQNNTEKLVFNWIIVLVVICLTTSCMTTKYMTSVTRTHEQVMNSMRTKSDVYQRFGPPEKVTEDGSTGSILVYTEQSTRAVYAPIGNSIVRFDVAENSYLYFYCRQDDTVYTWKSKGFDLHEESSTPYRAVNSDMLWIGASLGGIILVCVALLAI
jgi:hypothetical protein